MKGSFVFVLNKEKQGENSVMKRYIETTYTDDVLGKHGDFGGQKTLRGDVWNLKRKKNTLHPTMKLWVKISGKILDYLMPIIFGIIIYHLWIKDWRFTSIFIGIITKIDELDIVSDSTPSEFFRRSLESLERNEPEQDPLELLKGLWRYCSFFREN